MFSTFPTCVMSRISPFCENLSFTPSNWEQLKVPSQVPVRSMAPAGTATNAAASKSMNRIAGTSVWERIEEGILPE